jgi:hypothetical protein
LNPLVSNTDTSSAIQSARKLINSLWNCFLAAFVSAILFQFLGKLQSGTMAACIASRDTDHDVTADASTTTSLPSRSNPISAAVVAKDSLPSSRDVRPTVPSSPLFHMPRSATSSTGRMTLSPVDDDNVFVDNLTVDCPSDGAVHHHHHHHHHHHRNDRCLSEMDTFVSRPRVRFAPTVASSASAACTTSKRLSTLAMMTSPEAHSAANFTDLDALESNV